MQKTFEFLLDKARHIRFGLGAQMRSIGTYRGEVVFHNKIPNPCVQKWPVRWRFPLDTEIGDTHSGGLSMGKLTKGTFYTDWSPEGDSASAGNALQDVSKGSHGELKTLFRHIAGREPAKEDRWCHRLAPSIITRGELEMLGLSDPRFARRILFFSGGTSGKCLGFSNLRRINRIIRQLSNPKLLKNMEKVSAIADSILLIPGKFSDPQSHWRVLHIARKLIDHYGENTLEDLRDQNEADLFPALPFMKHVDIVGGGLCAQACCFMASLIMYSHAKRIFSIPEITFYGTKRRRVNMKLSGLNVRKTVQFFHSIELSATSQSAQPPGRTVSDEQSNELFLAIKSYLDAKCPVLCQVDSGRMMGVTFDYCKTPATNLFKDLSAEAADLEPKDRRHMIIVVGYQKHTRELLYHDPARTPYRVMPVSDLFKISCYQKSKLGEFELGEFLERPLIIPVLPGGIHLSLLDTLRDRNKYAGLFTLADNLDPNYLHPDIFEDPQTYSYVLTKVSALRNGEFAALQCHENRNELAEIIGAQGESLSDQGWVDDQWLWVQIKSRKNSAHVVFWNAEESPRCWNQNSRPDYKIYLIGAGCTSHLERGQEAFTWRFEKAPPRPKMPIRKEPIIEKNKLPELSPLQTGVITSFSALGISGVQQSLGPKRRKAALDLYCFMVGDTQTVSSRANVPNPIMCEWLASNLEKEGYVATVAKRIKEQAGRSSHCYAISTFFGGISQKTATKPDETLKALQCVLEIAGEYNRQVHKDKRIRVVEIVGGGLVTDHNLAPHGAEQPASAKVLKKKEGYERIIFGLKTLVKHLPEEMMLALELEPGPLFTVSRWEDLSELSKKIHNEPSLRDRVGFNCDIGHWSLSEISSQKILQDLQNHPRDGVASRIVHAHISDFGKGHFGDLCPATTNSVQFFADWLEAISRAYTAAKKRGLKPSSYVSIELELTDAKETLDAAFEKVAQAHALASLPKN